MKNSNMKLSRLFLETDANIRELERQAKANDTEAQRQLIRFLRRKDPEDPNVNKWRSILVISKRDAIKSKMTSIITPKHNMRTKMNPARSALLGQEFYLLNQLEDPYVYDNLCEIVGMSGYDTYIVRMSTGGETNTSLDNLILPEIYRSVLDGDI